jgi:two-component system phosphate regulon sensor histidine kinase PhoR
MTWHARWQQSPLNRAGLKLAGVVAVAAGGLLAGAASAWPWWALVAGALGLGAVTYSAYVVWVARRLDDALDMLGHIREHDFESLDGRPPPDGDELDALRWHVYRTGQTLETEIRELRRMESYRREFIGNVSHELKTPIFSVQGFAETLLDGALEDERVNRTFVRKILHNVSRLSNLARDLGEIARIETGELAMTFEAFRLGPLAEEVVESLEMKAADRDVTLRCRVPDALPPVFGDRERVRQVLVNLTDNAIKYNRPGGAVTLTAHARPPGDGAPRAADGGAPASGGDEVRVEVRDTGIGIAPEHIDRLTERFYRVDRSRSRNQGGTGLGLAIVKHILSAHDRALHVESTPEEGSTFHFTLPRG